MGNQRNFRDLIQTLRTRGLKASERPRSVKVVALQVGISTPHIYALMAGLKIAQSWTVAKIATNLKMTIREVQSALDASRAEAELLGKTSSVGKTL